MTGAKGRPMVVKLVACLVAMAVLVGAVFFLVGDRRGGTTRGGERRAAESTTARLREEPSALAETAALPSSAPSPVAREASAAVSAAAPVSPWRGELAGLIGRVVESDGVPLPGVRVALLEVDSSYLFDGEEIGADEPRIELEETVTDRDGRFRLGGARSAAFHGLGVDLGGPRATIRVLDHALPHGERTDVGDVVLAPYGVVTGRVIDEAGAPIAGARVRLGPYPKEVLLATPWEFRGDSLISVGPVAMGGEGTEVIDVPDWVRAVIDRFPVPTTTSKDDGTFRLEGVAIAEVVGGIDKRGYVGVPLGPVDVTGGEHDVGALVLKRGRTVRGVVEDGYGEPAAGVEVYAGAELFPGVVSILQPCGTTDDEGRFELSGVADNGQIVAACRRARHEPWTTATTPRHENVLLEIEATVQLTVHVRDDLGQPLSGAKIRVTPARKEGNRGFAEVLFILPKHPSRPEVFQEVEPGSYVNTSLGSGVYEVGVRAADRAPAFARAECVAQTNEVTLVCPPGRHFEVRVIDSVAKTPIARARASLLHVGAAGFTKIALESTDQDGRARLGPLPDFSRVDGSGSMLDPETLLLVQHPLYADHSAQIPPELLAAGTPVPVELQSGGVLAGRVHWGGAVPTRLYMLILEYRGEEDGFIEALHVPRFAVTDLDGEFRIAALRPGKYQVNLSERFLDRDPLGMIAEEFEPATLHRGEVVIKNGETTELVIDLTPTGRGATARVVGRVRLDGRALEGAEVAIRGNESVKIVSDSSGRFESQPFSVRGSVSITVTGSVARGEGEPRLVQLHHESVELSDGDEHEVVLDLYAQPLRVQVLDAESGAPVADAEVSLQANDDMFGNPGDEVKTNASGEAELTTLQAGEYVVNASASGFGRASTRVEVPAEGLSEPASIRLMRAVPCMGRIQPDAAEPTEGGRRFAYLHVQGEGNAAYSGTALEAPEYTFSLGGLGPGKYRAWIYLHGRRGEPVTFELGAEGARDLVLHFVPSGD